MTQPEAPGPWYFATLVVRCSECGARPSEACREASGRERKSFHFARYGKARARAGFPLKRDRDPASSAV